MVLAAWYKRRQYEKGFEIGRKQGRAEVCKLYDSKLRALAREYGIPEDELPFKYETGRQID